MRGEVVESVPGAVVLGWRGGDRVPTGTPAGIPPPPRPRDGRRPARSAPNRASAAAEHRRHSNRRRRPGRPGRDGGADPRTAGGAARPRPALLIAFRR